MQTAIRTALQGHFLHETPEAPSGGGDPQGQGASGGGGNELYEPYLADVPAEMHPLVLEPLRRQNADFTRKFQEASQFKAQWEPYAELGLNELDPEELQGLLGFRQQISTDDGAKQWLSQLAEQAPQIFPQDAWEQIGAANGWLEDGDPGEGGYEDPDGDDPPAWFQEFAAQQEQRWSQFEGQQQMAQVQAQQEQAVNAKLEAVEQKYADRFPRGIPDEIHDAAIDMAIGLVQSGQVQDQVAAIEPAFERLLSLQGKREGDEIEERLGNGNGTALSGGQPDTSPPKLSWNDNGGIRPRDAALARMRQ